MPKKTKGKYDKKSPRIGFHEWNLETIQEGAPELFNKALKEAFDIATGEYDVTAYFSYEAQEIAKIVVEFPLGPEEHENPIWEFELSDLVDGAILTSDDFDDDHRLANLRDRLRELADTIDNAISTPDKPPA